MKIEFGSSHHFTSAEAEAFLASWYRILEDDGSTVAYAPDAVTAHRIAAAIEEAKP